MKMKDRQKNAELKGVQIVTNGHICACCGGLLCLEIEFPNDKTVWMHSIWHCDHNPDKFITAKTKSPNELSKVPKGEWYCKSTKLEARILDQIGFKHACPHYKTEYACEEDPECPVYNGSLNQAIYDDTTMILDTFTEILEGWL